MQAAILSFSKMGYQLSQRIQEILKKNGASVRLYASEKYTHNESEKIVGSVTSFTRTLFHQVELLVFVGATGIAVRAIAPYIKSKTVDPAVLCLDDKGTFVISLLSGHIGGANRLTGLVARELGAIPVITTATDVNHRFSVDTWATEQHYAMGNLYFAKTVSAAILEGDIPLASDFPIVGNLPEGLFEGDQGNIGICISLRKRKPFAETLLLIPPALKVGIGCRRGTASEKIICAVQKVLEENQLDFRGIGEIASITLKSDEVGLLSFCKQLRITPTFYTAEELNQLEGSFTQSEFVKSIVGVDSVCERSAVMGGHTLIVPKTVIDGVTVAVAEKAWEVQFG